MPNIRIKTGPHRDEVFAVGDTPITIGRDPSCFIQIFDTAASRMHAEIFCIGEMVFARDLGSRNGTFVNEERIEEELLRIGDKVRIGSTVLVFEDAEAESSLTAERKSIPEVSFHDGDEPEEEDGSTIELNLDRKQVNELRAEEIGEEELAAHLGVLLELSKAISTEQRLSSLMDKVLEISCEGIGAKLGIIFLIEPKSGQFVPRSHRGLTNDDEVRVSRTIVRRVAQHRRAILTQDAASDSRFKATDSVQMKGIHSVICVPLVSLDKSIGIMYFESPDVENPFDAEDLELATAIGFQTAIAIQNVQAQSVLRRTLTGAIRTLVAALELHDPSNQGHSERVCTYASAIAHQMGLSEAEEHDVELAALLHDIGKLVVHERAGLEEAPGIAVEEHVLAGVKLLKNMYGMSTVLPGIRHHHEKVDGSGVPDHLTGADIPRIAKIVSAANVFDHLTATGGGDGQGLPTKEALLEMNKMGGTELDAEVVAALFLSHRSGKLFTPKAIFEHSQPDEKESEE